MHKAGPKFSIRGINLSVIIMGGNYFFKSQYQITALAAVITIGLSMVISIEITPEIQSRTEERPIGIILAVLLGIASNCRRWRNFNSLLYIRFSDITVLAPGITEEVPVILKQNEVCIVEASDDVPRQIDNCTYEQGEQITITYKREQPSIESHRPS